MCQVRCVKAGYVRCRIQYLPKKDLYGSTCQTVLSKTFSTLFDLCVIGLVSYDLKLSFSDCNDFT